MHLAAPTVVGREPELSALDAALANAREGRGGAVFLIGEAGIGKSRMAAEVVSRALESGMRVLRGRSSSLVGVSVPFRPVAEAMLGLFRSHGAPQHPDLISYRPALGRLIPEWRDPASPDAPESPVVIAEAVLRVVTLAGGDRGCVIVLEDLHDADAETLTVVEYLVDNLEWQPALLVGTVRPEGGPAAELVRSTTRRRAATALELAPLTSDQVHRLAAGCLGDVPLANVPPPVVERLGRNCGGNPFLIEELLADMLESGTLARNGDRWHVFGDLNSRVPTNVVRNILHRADRLGPQGHEVLSAAAVIGRRFPLSVVQEVLGLDDRALLNHLHAGLAARLLVPDDQAPDWYAFRHSLTGEALLAGLGPTKRIELARRCAEIVEHRHPGLPGDWCQLAAGLRLAAGDPEAAGRCFAEAGRRALAGGATNSAVALLERACELLVDDPDHAQYGEVLETLLLALIEAAQIERALAFADRLDGVGRRSLSRRRRAALHTQLAAAATVAGRLTEGAAQVAAARALVADDDDETRASIDAVAAHLALAEPGTEAVAAAERLATRAAETAARATQPLAACQAWHLLGLLARRRGIDESDRYFQRMADLAEAHQLSNWRLRAFALLAANETLRDGTVDRLLQVRDEAMKVGAVATVHVLEASLAHQAVLRGDYAAAEEIIDRILPAMTRLGMGDDVQYVLVARAAVAAHRGRRREMDRALDEFRRCGGETSTHQPIAVGLCRAVCALLDEDLDEAYAQLVRESEHRDSGTRIYHLTGRYGLYPLLRARRGELDVAQCRAIVEAPPSQLRWNRHFASLAYAIVLGRVGDHSGAEKAFMQAHEAGEPFLMARHLGLRLAAEAALADGWGDPVAWLREAEDYFHSESLTAGAGACRSLLRQAGASVSQRRDGYDLVPEALRRLGVTTREYEVLALLVDRMGNKEIAGILFISPRTVEKHVASLIAKTMQADRAALAAYAATAVRAGPPS